MSVRLNKLLAQRGVGARRKCDLLIQQGAVRVNGRVVREPGLQVEPERDRVLVNDRPLPGAAALRYYVLHKPVGVITTLDDPEGRRTVREFLPPGPRLFPVGRLDADTSGLLVLTNDGELAHKLMHPRYGVVKTYRVRLEQAPAPEALRRLQSGVEFEPGVRSAPARVRVLSSEPGDALIQIELHEGRYRQVRRMCEAVGLQVRALHRSAYGPLRLGPVPRGVWRELSDAEVSALRAASARPRARAGYRSPRAAGDAVARLARRLGRPPIEGQVPAPAGRRTDRAEPRGRTARAPRPRREDRDRSPGPERGGQRRRDERRGPAEAPPRRRRREDRDRSRGPERGGQRRRDERRGPAEAPPRRRRGPGERPVTRDWRRSAPRASGRARPDRPGQVPRRAGRGGSGPRPGGPPRRRGRR